MVTGASWVHFNPRKTKIGQKKSLTPFFHWALQLFITVLRCTTQHFQIWTIIVNNTCVLMSIWSYSTLYRSVHSSMALENWTGQQHFNNRKLLLKLLRRFIPFGLFHIHLFCRMLAFIRYIKVHFTFGLLDCARYKEDFVILRSCSIYFTVTLAGVKNVVCYTEDFVI